MFSTKRKAENHDVRIKPSSQNSKIEIKSSESTEKKHAHDLAVYFAEYDFEKGSYANAIKGWQHAITLVDDEKRIVECNVKIAKTYEEQNLYLDAAMNWNKAAMLTNNPLHWRKAAENNEKGNVEKYKNQDKIPNKYLFHLAYLWIQAGKMTSDSIETIKYLEKGLDFLLQTTFWGKSNKKLAYEARHLITKNSRKPFKEAFSAVETLNLTSRDNALLRLVEMFVMYNEEENRLKIIAFLEANKHHEVAAECWKMMATEALGEIVKSKQSSYWLYAAENYRQAGDGINEIDCLKSRAEGDNFPEHLKDLAEAYLTYSQPGNAGETYIAKAQLTGLDDDWKRAINCFKQGETPNIERWVFCLQALAKIYLSRGSARAYVEINANIALLTKNAEDMASVNWLYLFQHTKNPLYKKIAATELGNAYLKSAVLASTKGDSLKSIENYKLALEKFKHASSLSETPVNIKEVELCESAIKRLNQRLGHAYAFLNSPDLTALYKFHFGDTQVNKTDSTMSADENIKESAVKCSVSQ